MSIWKVINNSDLGVLDSISNEIADLESKCDNFLIDLRHCQNLILISDYSGHHKGALVESYSYLLTSFDAIWLWFDMRQDFRMNVLKNNRTMAFKSLNDKYKADALIPFLRIANSIPGLLFTVIIDKRVNNPFGEPHTGYPPECNAFKKPILRRIQLIGAFAGLVLAGMSAPNQNVLWITDEDEIAPNVNMFKDVTTLLSYCLSNILSDCLGHLRIATTKSDPGDLSIEDLASIPDMAAGALCESGPLIMKSLFELHPDNKPYPICEDMTDKTKHICNWFADGSCHALKKIVALVGYNGKVITNCISFTGLVQRPEFLWYDMAEEVLNRYRD